MVTKININHDKKIEFDGYLCSLVGKNGVGKTRLLEKIASGNITINLDGNVLSKNEIALLDINKIDGRYIFSVGDEKLRDEIVFHLMSFVRKNIRPEDIPATSSIEFDIRRYGEGPFFKARDILTRASELFNKEIEDLSQDEVQLSICLNNELQKSIIDDNDRFSVHNISQLITNRRNATHYNSRLKFHKNNGEKINPLSDIEIERYLGTKCPSIIFNEILDVLFRGKFALSQPETNNKKGTYTPKLLLATSGEEIKINDLSSGEKNIFWLALKTFEIQEFINHDLTKLKVMLLDEPDAFLHPQMILDFFESLKILHDKLDLIFIFTTHSPTTIALIPSENIFEIEINNKNKEAVNKLDKDRAISQLLEGITQLSIDPNNSRQIYVESGNDKNIYELIYTHIRNRSEALKKTPILTFISAGKKFSENELEKLIKKHFGENVNTPKLIDDINGCGDCAQVIGDVQHLIDNGNKTVRGIIDWDKTSRTHPEQVIVSAKDYAYSIENLVYDPISIYAALTSHAFLEPSYFFECEKDFPWRDALTDKVKLQQIVDVITKDLMGRNNNKDHEIQYMGGIKLEGDKEYYIPTNGKNGHDFQEEVFKKYPQFNKLNAFNKSLPLIYTFTKDITIGLLGWNFISSEFEKTFSKMI